MSFITTPQSMLNGLRVQLGDDPVAAALYNNWQVQVSPELPCSEVSKALPDPTVGHVAAQGNTPPN